MDLFNYDNFTGFHAIEAYWNQGNMIASILLCMFFLLILAVSLFMLALVCSCFYSCISKGKNNHENQSHSRHPEDRQDR